MTPKQQQAYDMQQSGMTRKQIAASIGVSESAVKHLLERARKWANADSAAQTAATVAGSHVIPHSFWVKTDTHSVYYQTPKDDTTIDFIELVKDAFQNIPQYTPALVKPKNDNRLTVYPLVDAHFGMRAWGRETGGPDYDLALAERDIKTAFANLWRDLPVTDDALLILGGDTLHADDNEGHTQSRSHVVDTDGRLYKVTETAIRAVCWIIEGLLERHSRVTVRVLRGNHDPHAHIALHFALAARYGRHVVAAERDLYWYRHGVSLIAAHHGDKGTAQRLCMVLADTCPDWSLTRDRHVFTGHIHHDSVKDFPGVKWWSLRAFCPPDEYGAAFGGKRALQGFVFSDTEGLKMQVIEGVGRG
jgi:DNA-binding CsgD family transcriptional regulator